MRDAWNGLRRVFRIVTRRTAARDVDSEIEFHLESRARDLVALGHGPSDARAVAEREFGDVIDTRSRLTAVVRRRHQRAQRADAWEALAQDVRFGARSLRRTPVFTLTVALVLALGVGANAAVFGLIDRVFLQTPAGVGTPELVRRFYYYRPSDAERPLAPANAIYDAARYPEYVAMRDAASGTAQLGTYLSPVSTDVQVGPATVSAMLSYADRGYFEVLQVQPSLGRFFAAHEDRAESAPPVAVISHSLWTQQFGGTRDVIGQHIVVGGQPYTIVGVAPPRFTGVDLDRADIWLPLGTIRTPSLFSRPWYQGSFGNFRVIARVASEHAERRATLILTAAYRASRTSPRRADTTSSVVTGPVVAALGPANRLQAESLSLRLSGVSFVLLLVACANAANMLLVRTSRRRRELAIRRALGGATIRLIRQLLIEGLLLSAIAGVATLFVALWATSALRQLLMPEIHWADASDHIRLFVFVAVTCLIAGPAAALPPTLRAVREDPAEALSSSASVQRRRRAWLRNGLLIGQAALSIVLLSGAGLFVGSLRNVSAIDLGFEARNLVTLTARYHDPARKTEVAPALEAVAAQLSMSPSVAQVATALVGPMQGAYAMPAYIPGRDSAVAIDGVQPFGTPASPGYFSTTGIKLVSGRLFDSTDRAGSPKVAVINSTMARTVWPNERAVGKCLQLVDRGAPCTSVIGVVEDTHVLGVIEKQRFMQVYLPLAQSAALELDRFGAWNRVLIVRTRDGAEQEIAAAARRATRRLLPDADVVKAAGISEVLDPELRPWRLGAMLFAILAALAASVAAVGVYGTAAFAASQRTHEMGIRIALGARRPDIIGLIVGDTFRVVVPGVLAGLALAIGLGRLLQSLLFGLSAHDPVVLTLAVVVMVGTAAVASFWPAWRASRVDPGRSLRAG